MKFFNLLTFSFSLHRGKGRGDLEIYSIVEIDNTKYNDARAVGQTVLISNLEINFLGYSLVS